MSDRYDVVAARLTTLGVDAMDPTVVEHVQRDGQVRVFWDATPLDLFFAYDPFHDAAASARHKVPFADGSIPILSASHLVVCKVVFNRGRDWVDIDAMLSADVQLDVAEVLRWVGRIAGDTDPRFDRIAALLTPTLMRPADLFVHALSGAACAASTTSIRAQSADGDEARGTTRDTNTATIVTR